MTIIVIGKITGISPLLKESQAYPPAFGAAGAKAFRDWHNRVYPDGSCSANAQRQLRSACRHYAAWQDPPIAEVRDLWPDAELEQLSVLMGFDRQPYWLPWEDPWASESCRQQT